MIPLPPNTPITVGQLDEYLRGTVSAGDRARVQAWLAEHPEARTFVERITCPPDPDGLEAAWAAVAEGIAGTDAAKRDSIRAARRGGGTSRFLSLAAAACTTLVFVAFGWWSGTNQKTSTSARSASIYSTPKGQRANITLPDGSQVVLNTGSRLEVPADFARGTRTLKLSGEALFTVPHKSTTPFIVIAGHSVTRVLGTRFLVRYFDTDTSAIIAVQDGKVSVESTVLTADQEFETISNGASTVRRAVASRFSFDRGVLSFDGVKLVHAIPDMNRWFDADVRLGDSSIKNRSIEGDYGVGSAGTLAEILEMTFKDLRVVRQGRVLTLYPRE